MIRTKILLGITALMMSAVLGASQANAAFMMSLDRLTTAGAPVGAAPYIAIDEGAGDGLPGVPAELKPALSSIDGFLILSARAITTPVAGPTPEIDLLYNVMNLSGVRSQFEIITTATDFTDTSAINAFVSAVSATSIGGDVVSIDIFVDDSNSAFGTGILLHSYGPVAVSTTSPFADDSLDLTGLLTAPYSMTIALIVELDPSKSIGGDLSIEKPVPEPTTFALGALGLLLLGACAWKKRRRFA